MARSTAVSGIEGDPRAHLAANGTPRVAVLGAECERGESRWSPVVLGPRPDEAQFHFPAGFLFGAATSAHQVEGYCTNNDWWAWEQQGRVRERSGAACDHYRRFEEDFDLAQALRHNAHRLSLEWSRIEPQPGRFSATALQHYHDVFAALRARGIEPMVTLQHFTLPRWVAERGGWENPEIVRWFARYAARAAQEYRHDVSWWFTLNEPMAFILKSYIVGEWPPGLRNHAAAVRALRNQLFAHVEAYGAIHAWQPAARVSVAQHGLAISAADPRRWRDRLSVRARSYIVNHLFLDALMQGALRIPGCAWERLPVPRTLDFLGLNYYTRDFVHNAGFDLMGLLGCPPSTLPAAAVGARNGLGWEVYPEGLGDLLGEFGRYGLPVVISENGIATESDDRRWAFIYMHLWQTVRALQRGVPVVGYLYWSLLDNFEWAEGYRARFGLVQVDYATQQRRVRPSAVMLRDVIRRNQL